MVYFQKVNEQLDVENLYLAGGGGIQPVNDQVRYSLVSYVEGPNLVDTFYKRIGQCGMTMRFPHEYYNKYDTKE